MDGANVHFRIARVGQDRASAQSPRAEFHSSLKPANNFAGSQQIGAVRRHIFLPGGAQLVGDQRLFDFGIGKFRTEIGVAQRLHGQPAALVEVGSQHRAERHPVIGCGGLHEKVIYQARSLDFAVGLGI